MRKININKPSTDSLMAVGSFVLTMAASIVAAKVSDRKNKTYLEQLVNNKFNTKND